MTPISDDLTKNIERISSPFFGQQQMDNPWDIYAMSNYTITSLSESPVRKGYHAGTDDGIIQLTQDEEKIEKS